MGSDSITLGSISWVDASAKLKIVWSVQWTTMDRGTCGHTRRQRVVQRTIMTNNVSCTHIRNMQGSSNPQIKKHLRSTVPNILEDVADTIETPSEHLTAGEEGGR